MSEKTEFADVRFKANEFGDGTFYLGTLENGPKTNSILNDTTDITLLFKKGISFHEAQAVASYLNERVERVGLRFKSK